MNLKKQITGLMMALLLLAPSASSAMTLEEMKETLLSVSNILNSMTESMSAQVVKSRGTTAVDPTAELIKPDQTHPDSSINYDVNRDGEINLSDLNDMYWFIRNQVSYNSYYDLNDDEEIDNDDFFLLRSYLVAQGDDSALYDVNRDGEINLSDLNDMYWFIRNQVSYNSYYDLNDDEEIDNDDFFLLRSYLVAQGDELAFYDINQDGEINQNDLDDLVWGVEFGQYDLRMDLNQDNALTSDDPKILSSYLDGSYVGTTSSETNVETDLSNFGQTNDRAELERQLQMLVGLLSQLLTQ